MVGIDVEVIDANSFRDEIFFKRGVRRVEQDGHLRGIPSRNRLSFESQFGHPPARFLQIGIHSEKYGCGKGEDPAAPAGEHAARSLRPSQGTPRCAPAGHRRIRNRASRHPENGLSRHDCGASALRLSGIERHIPHSTAAALESSAGQVFVRDHPSAIVIRQRHEGDQAEGFLFYAPPASEAS